MKDEKMGLGRMCVRFSEDEREWRSPYLLYADNVVLCDDCESDDVSLFEIWGEVKGFEDESR